MGFFTKLRESIVSSVTDIVDKVMYSDKRVEKQIERYNEKIEKVVIEKPEIADIQPSMIFHDSLIKALPKAELKNELKAMKNYTKKGAEQPITSKTGNMVTKWEKEEVEKKIDIINNERAKEYEKVKEIEVLSQGKEIGIKRKEMGSERLNALKPKKFDFDKIKGGKEWQKFVESIDRQASPQNRAMKDEQYKQNYISAMERVYGEHARELIDMVSELPAETVVATYYAEQEASMDFHYSPEEMEVKLEVLGDIWQGVYNNYLDEAYS